MLGARFAGVGAPGVLAESPLGLFPQVGIEGHRCGLPWAVPPCWRAVVWGPCTGAVQNGGDFGAVYTVQQMAAGAVICAIVKISPGAKASAR